jgi:DNA-binding response OmpR family regulator
VSGTEYAPVYLNAVTLLGADAALAKPFNFAHLVRTVTALLNGSDPDGFPPDAAVASVARARYLASA